MDNRSVTGRIFDIQRFSIHDGPGIRTIVFLKGCVLRCRWCCNPESQCYEIQNMRLGEKTKVTGRDVSVGAVMDEVVKDRAYYNRSGGGMTLSGGESYCQPAFAAALLMQAKAIGVNTAIETTSCASFETIAPTLPFIDTYLMDIKHMDPVKHKAFTTRSNTLMLENAVKIARQAKKMIVRVPVIPTFNDTVEEIGEIARFTANLQGVEEIHLLPYHSFGRDKYNGLGREYPMGDLQSPGREKMELLLDTVKSYGLKAQIGG